MMKSHRHRADPRLTSVLSGGVRYEHCQCGAIRRTVNGRGEWHICELCAVEYKAETLAKADA